MRKFSLEQYVEMSKRFNKKDFYDKIEILRDNSDILMLASDGNWWGVYVKDDKIQEQLFDSNNEFEIENEWGSSEMYALIRLLGIDNTDL